MDPAANLRLLRADHVGGLPRPLWLRDQQARFQRGDVSAAELEQDHRRAIAELVCRQEETGLGVVTDGEITRRNFQESFGGAVTGYDALPYEYPLRVLASGRRTARNPDAVPSVRAPSGMPSNGPPVLHRRPVTEGLRLSRNLIGDEYRRVSAVASAAVKVTLIGPDRIAQRFAYEHSRNVYPDLDAFDWVHREGSYDSIAERLYGELDFDRFLLEYDSDAAGGFGSLRFMPAGKIAVLGLVSNHGGLETRDYLRRRLEEATRYVPADRVALCPRCGFGASNSPEDVVWAKLALIRELADEVWP